MYRDSILEIEARHAKLRARLDELRPRLASLHALEAEAQSIERLIAGERAAVDRRLSLPLLDNLEIASPCSESWAQMRGGDRVRFCGRCRENVYDLSTLTREQAEALVFEREGRVCVRFYRRADGTILAADCPPGRRRVRRFRGLLAGIAAAVLTAIGLRAEPPSPPPREAAVRVAPERPKPASRFTGFEILDRDRSELGECIEVESGGVIGRYVVRYCGP